MSHRPGTDHDSREFCDAPQAIDRQSGFVLAVGWLIALLVTLT